MLAYEAYARVLGQRLWGKQQAKRAKTSKVPKEVLTYYMHKENKWHFFSCISSYKQFRVSCQSPVQGACGLSPFPCGAKTSNKRGSRTSNLEWTPWMDAQRKTTIAQNQGLKQTGETRPRPASKAPQKALADSPQFAFYMQMCVYQQKCTATQHLH